MKSCTIAIVWSLNYNISCSNGEVTLRWSPPGKQNPRWLKTIWLRTVERYKTYKGWERERKPKISSIEIIINNTVWWVRSFAIF